MTLPRAELGSGVLGTTFGVGVFLTLLFFASHVVLNLWAIATVDAVAHDAALEVALRSDGSDRATAEARALAHARASLGANAEQVSFAFEPRNDDVVALHVRAPGLRLLPTIVATPLGVEGLDRTVVVHSEARR